MFMAKVQGNVVTSQKVDEMIGAKLLIVDPHILDDKAKALKATRRCYVAVDTVGAGTGDYVLVTQGSSARMTETTGKAPVDCVIIGVIDTVNVLGKDVYKKSEE